METVNIDGYHQMSLLYKVIQVAFLGEHTVDLKRDLGLSPHLPSGPLLALSSPRKGSTRGAAAKFALWHGWF